MKKLSVLSAVLGLVFIGAASAADITIYHSPTCPHCHHARDFFKNTLIYEYPTLKVTEINVSDPENQQLFMDVLKKCEYDSGGVPVFVVGDKCFQGYGDMMADDVRAAVEVDLSDADKETVAANKKALAEDADAFKAAHADRVNAISEYKSDADAQKKNNVTASSPSTPVRAVNTNMYWYVLLIAAVIVLGIVLVRRKDK